MIRMEIEQSSSPQVVVAKRVWKILKIVLCMVRKGIRKSKLMLDLQMMLKRGKVVRRAIENLMLEHHHHLTCRSNDVHSSFISPREYEFSCSNSPAVHHPKRKHRHPYRNHHYHHANNKEEIKVFDDLSNYCGSVEASPLALPGFGFSPAVRQLRVTDSPFEMKGMVEENPQVDRDAEEFINNFYRDLFKQRRLAALRSPSPWAT